MTEKKGILETVFGKKSKEPYLLKVSWGNDKVDIPMRADIGSHEQGQWRELYRNKFLIKNSKGDDEINSSLYAAQLLRDFSVVQDFSGADVNALATELDLNMTEADLNIITDWWGALCGMTFEKMKLLASSKDFQQSR